MCGGECVCFFFFVFFVFLLLYFHLLTICKLLCIGKMCLTKKKSFTLTYLLIQLEVVSEQENILRMQEATKVTSGQMSEMKITGAFEQTEPKNKEEGVQKSKPHMHGKSDNTHLQQESELEPKWSIDYTNLNFHEVLGKGGLELCTGLPLRHLIKDLLKLQQKLSPS